MQLTRSKLRKLILNEISFMYETETEEHINELEELIDSITNLKKTLRKGKDRIGHRKESARLQSAIEAIRYLKRKSERGLTKNQMLSEGGRKVPDSQRAKLTPEVVTQAVSLYNDLIELFNSYLAGLGKDPVNPIRPVGSTYYYQEDLESNSDIIYGDVDYLVSLPAPQSDINLGEFRKEQSRIEREYTELFLNFLRDTPPSYVDVKLTGDVSPTMVIVKLSDGKKIQIDLIATSPRYEDWMQTRWVPEKGIKGYVGGNLYKSFGDTLLLTIGDQGVLARIKDGERVSSRKRGKDVQFIQISSNPSTLFKDIALYLIGDNATLSEDLLSFPGMNRENILTSDIAKGIRRVAENLESNSSLPDRFVNSVEMLEEVLARFKIALDKTIEKKSKPSSAGETIPEEKINKLVKMNEGQYNSVRNEFGL